MSRRTVISGLLALLFALAVWWQIDGWLSMPPPPNDPGVVGADSGAGQVSPVNLAPPAPGAAGAGAIERQVVATSGAPAPEFSWCEVRIVDGRSGAPVAGAEVGCMDGAAWGRLMATPADERTSLLADTWRCVAEFGRTMRSDADGLVHVRLDRSVTIHARHEASYGRLVVTRGSDVPPGGHRLELRPERDMQVLVHDAAGRPAIGVPLVVMMRAENGDHLGDYDLWPPLLTRAPNGVARVEHMQEWRPSGELAAPVASWWVHVALPGLQEVAARFDPASPPVAPIVLQLPPTGEVVARVVIQGRVVRPQHPLTLGLVQQEPGDALRTREIAADPDGSARFSCVPLQRRLRVAAFLGVWISRMVDGPREPGQVVTVDLSLDETDLVLTGRLLDQEGVPITAASVSMQYDFGATRGSCSFAIDATGHFAWVFKVPGRDMAELVRAELTVLADRPPSRATVPPRRLVRGVNDVGDLRVEPVAVVVAGTWQGLDPLEQRDVELRVESLVPGEEGASASWRAVGGLISRLFTDGRFAVCGPVEPGRLRLRVLSRWQLPIPPIEFAAGRDDVRLTFVRGANLTAYVRLPEPMAAGLFATLTPVAVPLPLSADEGHRLRAEPIGGPEGTCRLLWRSIPPGRYRLDIELLSELRPVVTIDDVEVPVPEGGDPRLREIDLRDRIHVITLHEPSWSEALAFPVVPEATDEVRGYPFRNGELALPTLRDVLDVLVVCPGRRPVMLRGVRDRAEVELQPWPLVELQFSGPAATPDGVTLRAALVPLEDADPRRYRVSGKSGAMAEFFRAAPASVPVVDGRAALPIGVGPHRLALSLQIEGWPDSVDVPHGLPVPLAGPGAIDVPIPADAIREALERLGRGPSQPAARKR